MIKTLTKVTIQIVFVACVAGCGQNQFVEAQQCVILDLRKDSDTALLPDFEAFARTNALDVDRTLPIPARYTLYQGSEKLALISYSVGTEKIGSELALYRFDEPGSARLAAAFGEFVDKKIKPRYAVYQCADVPDYAMPKASK